MFYDNNSEIIPWYSDVSLLPPLRCEDFGFGKSISEGAGE